MSEEVVTALIGLIPTILWITLIIGILIAFYKPIREDLLPRISGVQLLVVEIALSETNLDRALEERELSPEDREQLLAPVRRRVERVKAILPGARILWVDDHPANNLYEVRALSALGISIDQVTTSDEALSMLSQESYDLVISDIDRSGNRKEGIDFVRTIWEKNLHRPTVFYTGPVTPNKGVPPHAFGITDRPDHLLHLVLDVLERERS